MARRGLILVMAVFSVIVLTGCGITMGRTRIVPSDIADDSEKLIKKIGSLKVEMAFEEAVAALNIKSKTSGVRDIVERSEKQGVLYGRVNITGNPREIQEFNDHIDKHRILEIKFEDFREKLHIDSPISALTTTTGPQLRIHLIFYEGRLKEPPKIPSNFYTVRESRSYIFSIIGNLFRRGVDTGTSLATKNIK